jgi:hypothetical protein
MALRRLALGAALLALAAGTAFQAKAQDSVYIQLSTYRTGPYAGSGIPIANGMSDYLALLNERDGGVGGVRIQVEECETGYDTQKGVECYEQAKANKTIVFNPYSTGITLQVIPKAAVDKIPILSMAYGLSAAAQGQTFPWVFNPPATYWDGASAIIKDIADREGGLENLKGKKIGFIFLDAGYGREPIPLLEDILGTWPDARVNIDVKEANAIEPLVRVVERTNAYGRICVSSFSGRRIKRARKLLGPEVASGLAPLGIALVRLPLPHILGRLLVADVPCVQVPVSYYGFRVLTRGFVNLAHALGKQVHVWTVDDPDEMRALLDLGVDGLITDRIDTLRDVLTERGQWAT